MQITEQLLVGQIVVLNAEREQIIAQLNAKNGAIEATQIVLNTLRRPEPETALPLVTSDVPGIYEPPVVPAPEMLPVEVPAETDDLSLVERAEPPHSALCECYRCEPGKQ